jgi:hypothetical protein
MRPSGYRQDIADAICERIADGESLRAICRDERMPDKATVFRWLYQFPEFRDQYARAREAQADTLADEIIDIADDNSRDVVEDGDGNRVVNHDVVARARLRIDARKWIASKLKPKSYGDRLEVAGDQDNPIRHTISSEPLTVDEWAAKHSVESAAGTATRTD